MPLRFSSHSRRLLARCSSPSRGLQTKFRGNSSRIRRISSRIRRLSSRTGRLHPSSTLLSSSTRTTLRTSRISVMFSCRSVERQPSSSRTEGMACRSSQIVLLIMEINSSNSSTTQTMPRTHSAPLPITATRRSSREEVSTEGIRMEQGSRGNSSRTTIPVQTTRSHHGLLLPSHSLRSSSKRDRAGSAP